LLCVVACGAAVAVHAAMYNGNHAPQRTRPVLARLPDDSRTGRHKSRQRRSCGRSEHRAGAERSRCPHV
jgi:hypothetical protein